MAGDTKETTAAETPAPVVDDPFPGIQATLDAILREVSLDGIGEYDFGADGVLLGGSSWQRLRCRYLIVSCEDADTATLTVGTVARSWLIPANDTRVIPIPIVIERGANVTLTAPGGAVTGSLIARPE